jgi:hypothetical protein
MKSNRRTLTIALLVFIISNACAWTMASPQLQPPPTAIITSTWTPVPSITPFPTPTKRATITPEPTQTLPSLTVTPPFSPFGTRVTFNAEDGQELVGYYYITSKLNAPVIVMMHQFGTSQKAWAESGLIPWFQNWRSSATAEPTASAGGKLPLMPKEMGFNVFTFDFRGHGESGGDRLSSITDEAKNQYILDAKAAYAFARTLPNANPDKIIGFGTSIGADAVVDVCREGCVGAFAISPGDWLGVDWFEATIKVIDLGKHVRCMYSVNDGPSPLACSSVGPTLYYKIFAYPGKKHGMEFLVPRKMEADFGQNLLDFLKAVSK